MRSIAAGALCALLAAQPACIHNQATNIPATGEPLSVEFASTYRQGVWDENAARVRKQRDGKELAASQLFWDRDGTPPISANSRGQK